MKAVTAIKSCEASMSGLTDTAVKDCLDVEASVSLEEVTLKREAHFCKEKKKKMGTSENSAPCSMNVRQRLLEET